MRQPRFFDHDSRLGQPRLQLGLEERRDLVDAATKRDLVFFAVVVRVRVGEMPHGRFALHADVGL